MSADDFGLIAPHLEAVTMPRSFVFIEANQRVEFVYFPDSGVASIISKSPEGLEAEAGLFGRDGFAPTSTIMGADTAPNKILMQIGGAGWRLPNEVFLAAVEQSKTLRTLLTRYVQALMVQASYTALSNAVHPIDERLARWILMCDDRSDGMALPLTHEFMSIMLAVRRPSVTTALHVLEGNGFIRSERGVLVILNRSGMEEFAGDCYGPAEAEYRKLLGPMN